MTSLLHPVEAPAAPRFLDLRAHGSRPALRTAGGELSYDELADRVEAVARRLGTTRRLVLVEGANTVESLAAYLAAVTTGHVALLTPPGRPAASLVDSWDPDVVLSSGTVTERRPGTAHELHPDLALLLSTSGSTGSPKLVRLSHDNLRSNAASIVDYLGITPEDRALTSLPLHYCYGLSVVHSHLLVGASLVLTELSVVDECFWRLAADARATSLAGVPYTFEQLEVSGFERRDLPSLRYLTQAGGRMAPERVARWREHGRRAGWDLVVMYGQTEATARMAWLPPVLAARHPGAVGVPVPGGAFRLEPVPESDEPGVGELVYSGPNVMLGYAVEPADLARGRAVEELRTGDLGRVVDGVWEVVGRRGRQAKLFGLRLDLDHVERQLPVPAHCLVLDDGAGPALHAFTTRPRSATRLARAIGEVTRLPPSAVHVTTLAELPRTPSGKPSTAALAEHARRARAGRTATTVRDDYALVLGRPDATDGDTFVSLGGDSLSYVELATRLSARLGDLPTDWHTRPIGSLVPTRARRGPRVDTGVVLRAAAILAVVATHADVWTVVGGAHVLLVVAGWNLARFQLSAPTRRARVRHGLASLGQLVVPASLWTAAVGLLAGTYTWHAVTYTNGFLGGEEWVPDWELWFLEALVWTTLAALALLAVPAVDRLERRAPYGFALGLTLLALAWRYWWVGLEAGPTNRYTIGLAAFFVLLGWTASRADSPARRWATVGLAAVATYGFFGDPWREALVVAAVAVLVLSPTLRVPRRLVAPLTVLASASLWIYLTHWQVYPSLEVDHPVLATLASLGVGVVTWWLLRVPLQRLGRALHA